MKKETKKLVLSKSTVISVKTNIKAGATTGTNSVGRCDGGTSY